MFDIVANRVNVIRTNRCEPLKEGTTRKRQTNDTSREFAALDRRHESTTSTRFQRKQDGAWPGPAHCTPVPYTASKCIIPLSRLNTILAKISDNSVKLNIYDQKYNAQRTYINFRYRFGISYIVSVYDISRYSMFICFTR